MLHHSASANSSRSPVTKKTRTNVLKETFDSLVSTGMLQLFIGIRLAAAAAAARNNPSYP